jgi:hypothetical protein
MGEVTDEVFECQRVHDLTGDGFEYQFVQRCASMCMASSRCSRARSNISAYRTRNGQPASALDGDPPEDWSWVEPASIDKIYAQTDPEGNNTAYKRESCIHIR